MDSPSINARVDELRRTGFLGSPREERFDRITRLAQGLFGVDFAVINFVSEDSIVAKSAAPEGAGLVTPFGIAFCDVTVDEKDIVVVPDTHADPRFADRAAVAEMGFGFYAGVALSTPSQVPIGTLCLVAKSPREFGAEDQELLVSLSKWAERELEHTPAP